ncbi:MAG: MFS domain-containing protein [Shouchella clausii]|nr:hypothetical protein CHH54_01630 [Bacillus sp. 7520-S]PAD92612.1 hypothetical protein CHH52_08620 [Shouchella clausii]
MDHRVDEKLLQGLKQLKLLTNRNFILFFFGSLVSKIGDKLYLIAMPWIIYELTGSSFYMGVMFFLETIPFLFVSPLAGLLADRFSHKLLLFLSAFLQGFFLLTIVIGNAAASQIPIIWIFVCGFFIACGGAVFSVVLNSIIPSMFPKDKIVNVNSSFQFLDSTSLLFGSALAGMLISMFGGFTVLLLDAISFFIICAVVLFYRIKKENIKKIAGGSSWKHLVQGASYVKNHEILKPLLLIMMLVNISNAVVVALLVFFARDTLALDSSQTGLIYTIAAVSQVLLTFFIPLITKTFKRTNRMLLVCLMVSSGGIGIISLSTGWVTLGLAMMVHTVPIIIFNVVNKTLRMQIVPDDLIGRVNGLFLMLSKSTLPVAGLIGGVAAEFIHIRIVFALLCILSLALIVRYWFHPFNQEATTTLERIS